MEVDKDDDMASEGDGLSSGSEGDERDEAVALGLDYTPDPFYDPDADDKNSRWMQKLRKGQKSDAILSCPLCFTTLCVDCQQHVRYEGQFRAMFVMNCRVKTMEVVKYQHKPRKQGKGRQQQQQQQAGDASAAPGAAPTQHQQQLAPQQQEQPVQEDRLHPVLCAVCDTEVGLRDTATGEYHFFQVVPSNS